MTSRKVCSKRHDLTSLSNDTDVDGGRANEFIARQLGISPAQVARIKTLFTDPELKEQCRRGEIKLGQALKRIKERTAASVPTPARTKSFRLPQDFLAYLLEQARDLGHESFKAQLAKCPPATRDFIDTLQTNKMKDTNHDLLF